MSHINDDLLVKYLLGEATESERAAVDGWINDNDANKKHYEDFKLIWDESKKIASNSKVNVNDAWARFQHRTQLHEEKPKTIPLTAKPFNWSRVAAMLVVLLGAGWLVYTLAIDNAGQSLSLKSGDAVLTDTLPDGSIVTLNKNSSLVYNQQSKDAIRSVKLEGEAFFNVAPDKAHPFVINVNDAQVTVVGTSFNVKSTDTKTEVVVETGVVDVAKNENAVRLKPNEKATVLMNRDAPIKESSTDELYNYYKTKTFVCRNTPLYRLVEVLSEAYGVEIEIGNNAVNYLSITTTFGMDGLEEAFATIKETLPQVQVTKQGEKYILQ